MVGLSRIHFSRDMIFELRGYFAMPTTTFHRLIPALGDCCRSHNIISVKSVVAENSNTRDRKSHLPSLRIYLVFRGAADFVVAFGTPVADNGLEISVRWTAKSLAP